jgi:DNA-directed RNA polymerase subunit alpha
MSEVALDVALTKVGSLPLPVRAANCLKNDNILYVGDLVQMQDWELLRVPNLGRKSLEDIKGTLAAMGLQLGMTVQGGWPPESWWDE